MNQRKMSPSQLMRLPGKHPRLRSISPPYRFGETEELKKYVNSTEAFDINARDISGCTILLWAARNGHDETVKYLCSINADLNARGFGGWSALQHAVGRSRESMVALLLEHDANPNEPDETGTSALHIAAARGAINIVVRLIEAHADVNAQNAMGARPIHHGDCPSDTG